MALLPRNHPRNRIWQEGDPEPADHPDLVTLKNHRFHWREDCWRSCTMSSEVRYVWEQILRCHGMVSEDTSNHPCSGRRA